MNKIITLKKTVILVLSVIASAILIANLIGKEAAITTGNLGYVPISISLFIITTIMLSKFRTKSYLTIAWIMFLLCTLSWMIAEHIWIYEELVLHDNPFPSSADIFYVIGYVFLSLFSIYYLKIAKNAITKKMIITSVIISCSVLIPSLFMTNSTNSDLTGIAYVLAVAYPFLDAIVLVPALIGIMMFFRGEVSRMWTFFSLAIISLTAGDTGFLVTQMYNTYYTGHPIEIFLMWSYVFFSFGVYSNMKTFSSKKNSFNDKESLR